RGGEQVGRVAVLLALRNQDIDRAVKIATELAEKSKDYRDYHLLAQVYWTAKKKDEVEAPLRKAVELAEQNPETWATLILYLGRLGRREDAEKAIDQAKEKLPKETRQLGVAQCYDALGRPLEAKKQYEAALKEKPDDLTTLRSVYSFYLWSGQFNEAK